MAKCWERTGTANLSKFAAIEGYRAHGRVNGKEK